MTFFFILVSGDCMVRAFCANDDLINGDLFEDFRAPTGFYTTRLGALILC